MDVALVEKACALGLWEDKVGQHDETEVGVKRDPGKDKPSPVVEEAEA